MVQEPYAESTPAWYRYFTVIKVTTRVVKHCILGGQTPQDAVGGQFDMVYDEDGDYILFSKSTEHGHVHQMRNNEKFNYVYYFTPVSSVNWEN